MVKLLFGLLKSDPIVRTLIFAMGSSGIFIVHRISLQPPAKVSLIDNQLRQALIEAGHRRAERALHEERTTRSGPQETTKTSKNENEKLGPRASRFVPSESNGIRGHSRTFRHTSDFADSACLATAGTAIDDPGR